MYSVSEDYKAAIYKTPIYSKLSGTITLKDGTVLDVYDTSEESNVVAGSVSINNKCVSKKKLEYGSAYVGELNISIYNDIDRNALYGAEIALSWFLKIDVDTYEEIPLGVYIVSQAVRTKRIIKITAYDKMQLLDVDFTTATNGTVYEVLAYVAEVTGVELAQDEQEIEALTNGDRYVNVTENAGYKTYRDIVSDIAASLCCFATMTRAGYLALVPFQTEVTEIITEGRRNNTQIAEKVINYDTLRTTVNKTVYTVVKTEQTIGTSIFALDDNGIIGQGHNDEYITETLQNMVDTISELSYTPASCEIVANPALDLGDYVQLKTGETTECYFPIMSLEWKYHGIMKIKAEGESDTEGQSKTSKTAAGAADLVESSKNVILSYENARAYSVGSDYKEIIRLDYVSTDATKGLFHAQILLETSEDCEISFKYSVNSNVDSNFIPVQMAAAGKHIITLFYPLTDIPANTANSLRVSMTVSDGTATISAFNIKAAVAAQGLDASVKEWDGTIEIEETFTRITIADIKILPLDENADVSTDTPTASTISEAFTHITIQPITLLALDEQIGSGGSDTPEFVVDRAIVTFDTAENEYIEESEGRVILRDTYVYESEAETIDSGSICSVTVVTDDKESIESVVLENGEL